MRLRDQLLLWLLLPMLVLAVAAIPLQVLRARTQTQQAYDRTLTAVALAVSRQAAIPGQLESAQIPALALNVLAALTRDRYAYRIACVEPDRLLAGAPALPPPPMARTHGLQYYDGRYDGERFRFVALWQPVIGSQACSALLIQVAESTATREAKTASALANAAAVQLAMVVLAAILIVFGVRRGLAPLKQLRERMLSRAPGDLAPIAPRSVPREVVTLIDAMNAHAARQRQQTDQQRQFVADASHQLKTPLALIRMHTDVALRQADPARLRAELAEINDIVQLTSRTVHQLLALLRSEANGSQTLERLDLTSLARSATEELLPQALDKGVDLGFDGDAPVPVLGQCHGLHELVSNLVDNALRYTPAGGDVDVAVGRDDGGRPVLRVVDTGPGIPPEQREQVFERFYRPPGSEGDGCGLGLAIVRQICGHHGADIDLSDGPGGRGLAVTVRFPAPSA